MSKILTATCHTWRISDNSLWDSFPYWLESIKSQTIPTDIFAYFNGYHPDITLCKDIFYSVGIGYGPNRRDLTRINDNYKKFADSKNVCLKFARENGYNKIFLVDSDVVIRSNTLETLLSIELYDIISVLVNNSVIYDCVPIFNFGFKNNGAIILGVEDHLSCPVVNPDYTCACSLMNLYRLPTSTYSPYLYGEDVAFCESVRREGGEIGVLTDRRHEAYHIMKPELLKGLDAYYSGHLASVAYRHRN